MAQNLLSLCMIVRDERQQLGRCLESTRPFVDEMVVVDTGSRDGTVELARRAGARVLSFEWCDDFAAARNAALAEARGRFVLVLDADEWIESAPVADELRRRLAASDDEAFTVEVRDRLDGGDEQQYELVRLFRNRPAHRYEGAIHEQVTPAIARRLGVDEIRPLHSGLVIGHDGYLAARREATGKHERNLALLRRRAAERPDDPIGLYFLIRQLVPLRGGRAVPGAHLAEALVHCERLAVVRDRLDPSFAADFRRLWVAALLANGHARKAAELLEETDDTGPAFELLRADVGLEDPHAEPATLDGVMRRLERALDRSDPTTLPGTEPALAGVVARARIAELCLRLERIDEARRWAAGATQRGGGGATPFNALAAVERSAGDPTAALRAYSAGLHVDPTDPWSWVGIGELLLQGGDPAAASESLTRAATLAPGWQHAEEALAAALLLDGRSETLIERCRTSSALPEATRRAVEMLVTAVHERPCDLDLLEPDERESLRRITRRIGDAGGPAWLQRLRGA